MEEFMIPDLDDVYYMYLQCTCNRRIAVDQI
jgi:hypothetical protein